jgi:transcriptional regulator with GAF, ATPase, and Fis domain
MAGTVNIDQNEFFRQATLRICGCLEIEKAMRDVIGYLQNFIPVDNMTMHLFMPKLGIIRTIAIASADECEKTDRCTPLPPEAIVPSIINKIEPVRISNDPELDPINKAMVNGFGFPDSSLMLMLLKSEESKLPLGHVVLRSERKGQYTQEHLRLFKTLREPFTIALSNTLQHDQVLKLKEMLQDDNRYLFDELQRQSGETIIGVDYGLKAVVNMVNSVASKRSPVLLLGETGVGKDMIANMIHRLSAHKNGPFIKVNCGAIPDTLIDSELFGHEKGAFTGAVSRKRGRFERAHSGTIFLDEIAELPLQAQIRLLRVLQHKEIERVGGTQPISLDIRVIAATHQNLEKMVSTQKFREDLWFRLNVFPIHIPPLCERLMDIGELTHHLIEKKRRELQLHTIPELAPGTIDRLMAYQWPGNVRELENLIERALILCDEGPLVIDPFLAPAQSTISGSMPETSQVPQSLKFDDVMTWHIERILEKTGGKIHGPGGAAKLLDMNAGTLRNRMNKMGIIYGRRRKSLNNGSK